MTTADRVDGKEVGVPPASLPDIPCPFPGRSSPYAREAAEYVRQVAGEVGLTDPRSARIISGIALGEAAALTFPRANPRRLGVAALWIAWLVCYDDAWSDRLVLDGEWRTSLVQEHRRVQAILDGRSGGDDPLGRLLHRLLAEMTGIEPDRDSTRFRNEVRRYLAATRWETELRARHEVPDLCTYLTMRRVFSTMTAQLEVNQFIWSLRLPEPLREHPALQLIDIAVATYAWVANDLYSWEEERASGLTSNIVTVLENQFGWSSRQAISHAEVLAKQALNTYLTTRGRLPALGVDAGPEVHRYLDHYEAFMSASIRWPQRSARYSAPGTGRPAGGPLALSARSIK